MGEVEVKETNSKELLKKLLPRIAKATIATGIVGACLLIFWFVISDSALLAWYPEYQMLFAVIVWATVFFTFAIRVTNGTVYKYCFVIGRALFIIIYTIYATNGGMLTLDLMDFHLTVEFIPLVFIMILTNLLGIAKGVLQAMQFTSESPAD